MWTAYALNNLGANINTLHEAFCEVERCVDVLIRDVELYMHREAWNHSSKEEERLQVLRQFQKIVYIVLEEEGSEGPSQNIRRAQSLLEEMQLHSFLRPYMDLLMDQMLYKDVKEYVEYVSLIIILCMLICTILLTLY